MTLQITIEGKYAERQEPRKQIRVLCIDRANGDPVVAMSQDGRLLTYRANGQYYDSRESEYDLVPFDETPVITPGRYRTRGDQTVVICYIREGTEYHRYLAIGWVGTSISTFTWRLDGRFSNVSEHERDLVERIGDL